MKVEDSSGTEISFNEHQDKNNAETKVENMFPIMFTEHEPILVKKGWKVHIVHWIRADSISDHMAYGENGDRHQEVNNEDKALFDI